MALHWTYHTLSLQTSKLYFLSNILLSQKLRESYLVLVFEYCLSNLACNKRLQLDFIIEYHLATRIKLSLGLRVIK
jgi:hypothetical protein